MLCGFVMKGLDFIFVWITEIVQFEKYKVPGFVGRCNYRLPAGYSELILFQVHVSARYAGVAGVGYKVTMGLGDTGLPTKK